MSNYDLDTVRASPSIVTSAVGVLCSSHSQWRLDATEADADAAAVVFSSGLCDGRSLPIARLELDNLCGTVWR